MKIQVTSKRSVELDTAESYLMGIIALATVLTVFCLVSAKALLSQAAYQQRVINARNAAKTQIQTNISRANTLIKQYNDVFQGTNATNVLGGNNTTDPNAVPPDGTNGRLVLDALPTTYDFPALLTSLQTLVTNDGIGGPTIGGTDQSTTSNSQPAASPSPVKIDMTLTGTASYANVQKLIQDMERSIRPIDITKLTFSGDQSNLTVNINFSTYYQPAKSLNVNNKEVR